jgi:hypothetical protein
MYLCPNEGIQRWYIIVLALFVLFWGMMLVVARSVSVNNIRQKSKKRTKKKNTWGENGSFQLQPLVAPAGVEVVPEW